MESILFELARTAAIAAVVAFLASVAAGSIGLLATAVADSRAARALATARMMAVFGGAAALTGSAAGVAARFTEGHLSASTLAGVEVAIAAAAIGFAVVVRRLLAAATEHGRR